MCVCECGDECVSVGVGASVCVGGWVSVWVCGCVVSVGVGASVCIFECANVVRVCVSVCILNVWVVWCGVCR